MRRQLLRVTPTTSRLDQVEIVFGIR